MTLNFKPHHDALIASIHKKAYQLLIANVPARQALNIIQHVIRPKITYSFPITPFSITDIEALDHLLTRATRACMGLGQGYPSHLILCPTERGGVGLTSLLSDCDAQISTETLTRALNDTGDLGLLTTSML